MRKIMTILLATLTMVACKKSNDLPAPEPTKPTPVLNKKSPAKTTAMPKTKDTVTYSMKVTGKSPLTTSFMFDWDATFPVVGLTNFKLEVVKDGNQSVVDRKSFPLQKNAETIIGGNMLEKDTAYTLRIIFDVNPTVLGTFSLMVKMITDYNGTDFISSNPITFATALASTVQISNVAYVPASQAILGNQEFELSKVDMLSNGGNSDLSQIKFFVGGDPGLIAVIQTVKVYDGAISVGSANVVPGTLTTATVALNINLLQGTPKTLTVKVVIGAINSASASSPNFPVTFDVGIVDFTYTDAGGMIKVGTYGTGISNKFALLKSMQTITSFSLSGNLQNGVVADVYKYTVTSNTAGSTANKQFAFDVTLTDNGTHLDTLSLTNLSLKINGIAVTNVRFTNSSGQVTDTITASDPRVYVTFVSGVPELVTSAGATTTIVLSGKFRGFNHPTDGDVASIKLITTDSPLPSTAYRYVNSGVSPTNLAAKIWTSPTANAGAIVQNLPWSDMSDPAHSFAYGAGTADAKNGSIGIFANTNPQVWIQ